MDRYANFNFKKAVAVYSLPSALLSLMGEHCAHCSHVCECIHTLAVLVAVAPLSALESDANLHIKLYLSSTFTIFNITLTFVYN